jgi:integrase
LETELSAYNPYRRPVEGAPITAQNLRVLQALAGRTDLCDETGEPFDPELILRYELKVAEIVEDLLRRRPWSGIDDVGADFDAHYLQLLSEAEAELENPFDDQTHRTYEDALRQYARFFVYGEQPYDPRKLHPRAIVAYLHSLGEEVHDPQTGELLRSLRSYSTIKVRLAALAQAARSVGAQNPWEYQEIKDKMRHLERRCQTMRPLNRKDAITSDILAEMIETTFQPDLEAVSNRALAWILADEDWGPADAAALEWDRIQIKGDVVVVRPTSLHKPLVLSEPVGGLSPVDAFTMLAEESGASGAVFRRVSGPTASRGLDDRPLTRQAIALKAKNWRDMVGVSLVGRRFSFQPAHLESLADSMPLVRFIDLRDRALLLVGYFTAMRRLNLSELDMRDVALSGEMAKVTMRWSKTGEAHTFPLPAADGWRMCPTTALTEYVAALEGHFETLDAYQPLFVTVDRHGNVPAIDESLLRDSPTARRGALRELLAISGAAVADVVKTRVAATGRDPRFFGAHSLRAGILTDMAHLGFEPTEMQEISLHRSLNQLIAYVRTVRHPSQQPAHRLALKLQENISRAA